MPSVLDPLREFPWTANAEKAAMLIAEGQRTQGSVGEEVGVHKDTIRMWTHHPDFRERVKSIIDATREQAFETGVMNKLGRVAALQDTWQRLRQIIDERAEAPEYQDTPGGTTGLLIRRQRTVGSGRTAVVTEEYDLDSGLLSEMRSTLKQIAQEQGQWTEKTETEHSITRVEVVYQDQLPQDL